MTAKHIVKRMVQQDLHSVLIITVVVALHPANYHSISLARCIHLKVSTSMRLQQTIYTWRIFARVIKLKQEPILVDYKTKSCTFKLRVYLQHHLHRHLKKQVHIRYYQLI